MKKQAIVGCILGVAMFFAFDSAPVCSAGNADYSNAMAALGRKDYTSAMNGFARAARTDPRNASAYLYAARCAVMLGRTSDAVSWYKAIETRFPRTEYAEAAAQMLPKLGARAVAPGPGNSAGGREPIVIRAGSSDDDDDDDHRPYKPTQQTSQRGFHLSGGARFDPNKMIVVVAPRQGRYTVDAGFVNDVKQQLMEAPSRPVAYLFQQGCKVYITPTAVDKDPELERVHPGGYENGKTFRNVPAYFDGKNLVVCEYVFNDYDSSVLDKTDDPLGSFKHELGHAVDHYLGNLSGQPEYRKIYSQQSSELSEYQRRNLQYYLQQGRRGPAETFAELFAGMFGGRGTYWRTRTTEELSAAFSDLKAYMEKRLREMNV